MSLKALLTAPLLRYSGPLGMVAPSRELACRSRSSLVIPLTPRRSAPLRSARRSSCSRRTASYWQGWARRDGSNTDNTLRLLNDHLPLSDPLQEKNHLHLGEESRANP